MSTRIAHDRMMRRKRRVSANIQGTKERPRVVVYRSHVSTYVQAIDDIKGVTVASYSSVQWRKDSTNSNEKKTKSQVARVVGKKLGDVLKSKRVKRVVFDRSRYAYLGRVKEVADGVREAGLQV